MFFVYFILSASRIGRYDGRPLLSPPVEHASIITVIKQIGIYSAVTLLLCSPIEYAKIKT